MQRRTACLILIALWAVIYLPGLGSTEIKGEEGRRILPAVTMLETGNWLVPYVGGEAYLRKPPLMNWVIALSMKWLGRRDEWAARLPSAVAVLVCGLGLIALSRPRAQSIWTPEIAFIATIFTLTASGLLAKARFAGAEIEGVYVPLAGMGIAVWMIGWEQRRSAWLTWGLPFALFGLATLAKAPLHLLFFYAIVAGVLWQAKEWRALWQPAHFLGLAVMVAIFAAWALPYFQSPEAQQAATVWKDQFVGRVAENKFDARGYLLNLPRGVADQLPWLLFAPVLWARQSLWSGREGALVRGVLFAGAVCFVGLLLVPGVLTRYVLPLGLPLAMLLALAIGEETLPPPTTALRIWWRTNSGLALGLLALACFSPVLAVLGEKAFIQRTGAQIGDLGTLLTWPLLAAGAVILVTLVIFLRRNHFARPTRLAGASAALMGAASMLFTATAVPFINRADNLRPLAAAIDAAVPDDRTLYIFDPEYQPAIFYLRTTYRYAPAMKDLPADAEFVLARGGNQEKLLRERPELVITQDFGGRDKNRVLLLQRRGGIPNDRAPEVIP